MLVVWGISKLDPDLDPSRADISTFSGCTFQLEFASTTNRRIPSPEAIQAILIRVINSLWGGFEQSGHKKKTG